MTTQMIVRIDPDLKAKGGLAGRGTCGTSRRDLRDIHKGRWSSLRLTLGDSH